MWSTVATGFKLGLREMTPIQLLWIGTCVSLLYFVVHLWFTRPPIPRGKDAIKVASFGLINPFSYYLILFAAYDRLPAQIAQPLNFTWAIFLAVLAIPLLKQKLNATTAAGIVVSYVGVGVLIVGPDTTMLNSPDGLGIALALFSAVLWAFYWLSVTRSKHDPVVFMALGFVLACPLLTIACVATDGLPSLSITTIQFGLWVGLIEMGITFVLWQRAMRLTNYAARVGQLIFLAPFGSFVLIHLVLGEAIVPPSIAGLVLIVGGTVLVNLAAIRQDSAERPT